MPGVTGLDLQKTLADAAHRIPVVFVTGHGDISMSVTALKDGAVDFLTKTGSGSSSRRPDAAAACIGPRSKRAWRPRPIPTPRRFHLPVRRHVT